jgi:large subunit ribosomal protein L1
MDKAANLGIPIGKRSFTTEQLLENAATVINAVGKSKPASLKGRFILNATLSATMSPGVALATSEYSKF